MNKIKAACFFAFTYLGISSYAHAQKWMMKETPIQTRWASKVSPDNVLPEYPRPQMVRKQWTSLNGIWQYAITKQEQMPSPDSFNAKILVPFPLESALSGVKRALLPSEILWYKRIVKKPALKGDERLLLHFGAVDWDAKVYINGVLAGSHQGGYQEFSFDVTPLLTDGDNIIVVKVKDPSDRGINPHGKQVLSPGGIMYTASSGIWQTVWMEIVNQNHLEQLSIIPDIDNKIVRLKVTPTLSSDAADYTVEATVPGTGTVTGKAKEVLKLPVSNMRLWSPEDPYLYKFQVKLLYKGKPVDEVSSYFGMRKCEVKKDEAGTERIFLNNKPVYNLGVLDQGFWPDGLYTAPTDEALQFDIKAIKSMGFNTIRKHIKIEPARWYYYADKLGMLVWQDMINPGNETPEARAEFEKENAENVAQLRNYPSIITWVVFNEGWGAYDQARITQAFKELDPTRIINGHTGENYFRASPQKNEEKWKNSDLTDIHAYPDPNMPPILPGKAAVLGEFGGIGVSIEDHLWNELNGWGYINITPGELLKRYAGMTDSLKVLRDKGLAASIYTEPFDVETEQNGLITYDREIIKIPVDKLREIHSALIPMHTVKEKLLVSNATDAGSKSDYDKRLAQFTAGNSDSVFLRKLLLLAYGRKDTAVVIKVGDAYIAGRKNNYVKENFALYKKVLVKPEGQVFRFFVDNHISIDSVWGKYTAADVAVPVIYNTSVKPRIKAGVDDWDKLEAEMVAKYGPMGGENVRYMRMSVYLGKKQWDAFGKAYLGYFEKYGDWFRGQFLNLRLNDLAWAVFQHVGEVAVINEALNWMHKVLKTDPDSPVFLDTYANLLYKKGDKQEAINVEETALSKETANAPKSDLVVELKNTLDKMKKNENTW
ncbi:glycoside hydrolase family 2 protein [Deminuibacter soli]|uniref:Glycoside hydrolase family 2 n=1 Tax=Deminuibacter soli TaxID=2291815 RepID=A0A3E1NJW7_9BACT|nr:sugar-binding domain-containing protein [Deminuibacter soli]RFM28227.1 glycoside hydrolase family 2 [Deminuibacter soli]